MRSRLLAGMLGHITIASMVTGTVVYLLQLSTMDNRIGDHRRQDLPRGFSTCIHGRATTQAHLVFAFDYSAEKRALNNGFLMYLLVGVGVLLVAGVTGWLLVGRLLLPVTLLRDTARQISESDLSQRIEVVGRDDLAELTVTVTAMLDRLESAMVSHRQLLDDVGHELRTPVTIIRGHLEPMDRSDPDEVDQARDIALAELDRMSYLINDLVTLPNRTASTSSTLWPPMRGRCLMTCWTSPGPWVSAGGALATALKPPPFWIRSGSPRRCCSYVHMP